MAAPRSTRIGIDTGGTFTDVVRRDGGRIRAAKVPSTPADPARAVRAALEAVGGLPAGGRLHHGTTVGTNAVLTRAGARVALAVTAGFEDLLEVDRGHRASLHDLHPARTPPLVARARCVGVEERMGAEGRPLRTLSAAGTRRVVRSLEAAAPDAVAVCLLHAARFPRHERVLASALRRAFGRRGPSVHVSTELSADGREVERAATAVLDAFVGPVVAAYVARVARAVPPGALTVMRSDGGRMSSAEVARAPVRTLLSGPAAGVAAAHALAARLPLERALSFDVGGTSTDVAWLEGADLPIRGDLRVGDHRASVPSLALETVGAGGGSEVRLDEGGALRVGPASAGADPGPACYGRGGPFTLTDAWLLLDRLPEALLGGTFPLAREAAERAGRPLARAAGCSLRRLAEGAVAVAAATTARALRRASAAEGRDPRGAALVAFGGAGPLLAAETAVRLGLDMVVVPERPGTFAADGTLVAPLRLDASRAWAGGGAAALRDAGRRLAREVRARLAREGARRVRARIEVDARYAGQAFVVGVPFAARWQEVFHDAHAARYGFSDASRAVEVVGVRARGEGWEEKTGIRAAARRAGRTTPRAKRSARAHLLRRDLDPGVRLAGPLRVEERTGTTWVPGGWTLEVLPGRELRLEGAS
ncbi:MAG: hydantoinase/oxoprolinase family protein [Planctomycetota bacterium]|jgi:N-methylhydantoinase A